MADVDVVHDGTFVRLKLTEKNLAALFNFTIALKDSLSLPTDCSIVAIEYVDEEGDRICVQTEDEFQCMINLLPGCSSTVGESQRFTVFPTIRRIEKKPVPELPVLSLDNLDCCISAAYLPDNDHSLSAKFRSQRVTVDTSNISIQPLCSASDLKPLEQLGAGHSGTVYKSLDLRNDRFVAVKSVAVDLSSEDQDHVLSEMSILYKCSSPFIIDFYGSYFVDNRIFICTEYMDGGSMDKYGKIPENTLSPAAVALVEGLDYLWSLKILHRDVKPSNILINTRGDIKLCDFGVSVQLANSIARTYVGSKAYMSPERLMGKEYKISSDVWSLGLSLMEMALGYFPYEIEKLKKERFLDTPERIINDEPPCLNQNEFGADFCDFIKRCMVKNPEERASLAALRLHPLFVSHIPYDSWLVAEWLLRKSGSCG